MPSQTHRKKSDSSRKSSSSNTSSTEMRRNRAPGKALSSTSTQAGRSLAAESAPNASPDARMIHSQAEAVWDRVKGKVGNQNTKILAVCQSSKVVSELLKVKRDDRNAAAYTWNKDYNIDQHEYSAGGLTGIVMCTPDKLQEAIQTHIDKSCTTLWLVVSSAVKLLQYHIPERFKELYVVASTYNGDEDKASQHRVLMDGRSTYCGVEIWKMSPANTPRGRSMMIADDCQVDTTNCTAEIQRHVQDTFSRSCNLADEELKRSKDSMPWFGSQMKAEVPEETSTASWFPEWVGLLGSILAGSAAGCFGAAGAGTFWCTAGGIAIKGPLGLMISGGFFSVGAAGVATVGAGAVGGATVAIGLVYYIPWDKIRDWMYQILTSIWKGIWKGICDVWSWLWEKIKNLPEDFCEWWSVSDGQSTKVEGFA